MNWTKFQTYNNSYEKAFEMLCNQLFENWCSVKYEGAITNFEVINGAGGDGGVESFAQLKNGSIVGVQAKWFINSMGKSQIEQIKKSILTALKIRPEISKYIVCLPRNISSKTARKGKPEDVRWNEMKKQVLDLYPKLDIELWDENRILKELQKESSSGIFKFWFETSEISNDSIKVSFEKSKNSWLDKKYVPNLNTYGFIYKTINSFLRNKEEILDLINKLETFKKLSEKFIDTSNNLIEVCCEKDFAMAKHIDELKINLQKVKVEINKIIESLKNESVQKKEFDQNLFYIDFYPLKKMLKDNSLKHNYYFHFEAVIKILEKLENCSFYQVLNKIKKIYNSSGSLIILGNPGTGKTHGIAALTENLLCSKLHIPILIQASSITYDYSWKDIITSTLGLSNKWSEDDIWQGLSSLANKNRFIDSSISTEVTILPKIIFFVDGLDETSLSDRWIKLIQETNVITKKYPTIKFCFLSRPHIFHNSNLNVETINIDVNGDVPVYKLFDAYISAYNVDVSNSEWIRYVLDTPLSLKLFCEINKNKKVEYKSSADVSIESLIKEKIVMLEKEFCKKETDLAFTNQYIHKSILLLSNLFIKESRLEKDKVIKILSSELNLDYIYTEKVLKFIENYGILHLYKEASTKLLETDKYFYYPGIQGYFDYVSALLLLQQYEVPKNIDFSKCQKFSRNLLYILAIVSIRSYDYLISDNNTLIKLINEKEREYLLLFSLRYSKSSNSKKYKKVLQNTMNINAQSLNNAVNNVILPLSREPKHPLGVTLLDDFLNGFNKPALRDMIWCVPANLKESYGKKWECNNELNLSDEMYKLSQIDSFDGLPVIYAWSLSSVENFKRQEYRTKLMEWAYNTPEQFYQLFLKFAFVNDPQIRSDMYSILMSLLFEVDNIKLLKIVSEWLIENILSPQKIDENCDISIRYYCINIIRKAITLKIFKEEDVKVYLPPYYSSTYNIPLNKDALTGSRMGGYSGITYDLSRYVLIDHITTNFSGYDISSEKQIKNLINCISKKQKDFKNITIGQLILSSAFAYISECGWDEKIFQYDDENNISGIDCSISQTYWPSTHGTKSPVMTVCEKYVWQARYFISGFMADRLLYLGNEEVAGPIEDYDLLDKFVIPALEIEKNNYDEIIGKYPWHILEKENILINNKINSKTQLTNMIENIPDITFNKWIAISNKERIYPIDEDDLLALYGYSSFECPAGMETNIFINSILIKETEIDKFKETINNNENILNMISNPCDWMGGYFSDCYITPKEICWMEWKKRFNSSRTEYFPNLEISSAVDECTYYFADSDEIYYKIPSDIIRKSLGINNTNGYIFYDKDNNIKSIYTINGEKWHTQQNYLLVGKKLLSLLSKKGKTILWIMKEYRRESGIARERFEGHYVEKDNNYIGFIKNNEFIVEKIMPKKT